MMWSSSYAVIKLGVATIDPIVLVAGPMAIGALTIYGVLSFTGRTLSRDVRIWVSYVVTGLEVGFSADPDSLVWLLISARLTAQA